MFPSKDYIYRTETEATARASGVIPNIPAMPIGYRDALKLMQKLDGFPVQVNFFCLNLHCSFAVFFFEQKIF